MDYSLVSWQLMAMVRLKNKSTNHLRGHDLPFVEGPLILTTPQEY